MMKISGYSLLRVDHPNNIKRGGVCTYFKESLPLIRRSGLRNMKECLVTEINVNNEKCFFTCHYRSPSQSHEELRKFLFQSRFPPFKYKRSTSSLFKCQRGFQCKMFGIRVIDYDV